MPVPLHLNVRNENMKYLNEGAKQQLHEAVLAYTERLLDESGRLEGMNSSAQRPELTSTLIMDARLILDRGYAKRRRSKWETPLRILALGLTFVIGVLTTYLSEQWAWPALLFVVVLVLEIRIRRE